MPVQKNEKPLPPPIEMPKPVQVQEKEDRFGLGAIFGSQSSDQSVSADSFATSSTSMFEPVSEHAPGEPIGMKSEKLISEIPESVAEGEEEKASVSASSAGELSGMIPEISFDAEKVERVLEEIFDWMAERFDSPHWKLTERQSSMLGEPTAQLLSGVWTKLSVHLPDMLTTTPGATAFLFAFSVVVVPKAAQQMALTRARRQGIAPRTNKKAPGPIPVPQQAGAVGPISDGPVEPLAE